MTSRLFYAVSQPRAVLLAALMAVGSSTMASTLSVGPGKSFAAPCAAFAAAANGDIIEIDAAGTYRGDVCGIYPSNLTIRGINGRPKIDAGGQSALGKGTWVLEGGGTTIENVEMFGAAVADQNGAAIRLDGRDLTLRGSYLHHNENGILTNNDGVSNLVIENSEFSANGYGTGYTHNLYVGHVNSLVFRGNYTHDANVGHNLKSRAQINTIIANRFSSTEGGQPSYEADFPNGGTTYFIGNVVQQPASNQNPGMLAYGEEGASNTGQDLYVVNNTFVNDDSNRGTFLLIGGGIATPVLMQNNIFAGTGNVVTQGNALDISNIRTLSPAFVDRAAFDFHPAAGSPAIGGGTAAGTAASGFSLTAMLQYKHVASTEVRPSGSVIDIGAYAAVTGTAPAPTSPATPVSTSPFSPAPIAPVPAPGSITELPAPAPGTAPTVPTSFLGFKWNACGAENTTCQIPGLSVIRYGANGQYKYQVALSASSCSNQNFGDPIVGSVKSCDYISFSTMPAAPVAPAPVTTSSWVACATENGACIFSGTRQVRYGAQGTYAVLAGTGSVDCNNATFGDPVSGIVKGCEYQVTTTAPVQPSPVEPLVPPVLQWTACANENGACAFTGVHQVRYGAQGTYATLLGNSGIACNNDTFGDPLAGVVKACEVLY